MNGVNVFEVAAEAARKVGAVCPEGVAEYLKDRLTVMDSIAGPQVMVRNSLGLEPMGAVMARMQVTKDVAALFHGGKPDVRTMDHDLYLAIRKHKPELLGLRHKR